MKYIKRIISLTAVLTLLTAAIPFRIHADDSVAFDVVGWCEENCLDAVKNVKVNGVELYEYNPYMYNSVPELNVVTAPASSALSVEITLQDGYVLSEIGDGVMLLLGGVQSGSNNVKNSRNSTYITLPSDSWHEYDHELFLAFRAKRQPQPDGFITVDNIVLNAQRTFSGTTISDTDNPVEVISVPDGCGYAIDPGSVCWVKQEGINYIENFEPFVATDADCPIIRLDITDRGSYIFSENLNEENITVNNGELLDFEMETNGAPLPESTVHELCLTIRIHKAGDEWSFNESEHWHNCENCNSVFDKDSHIWNEPVWNWDDVEHPTYTATCSVCEAEKSVEADSVTSVDTPATTEADGYTTYTASVDLNGQTVTDDYVVTDEGSMLEARKDAFDEYKDNAKEDADALAQDGDSDAVKAIIADAKDEIDALEYDEEKSLEENEAAVDAILSKLEDDLTVQRNIHTATWIVDGKEFAKTQSSFGQPVTQPRTPQKDGYTFRWIDEIPATMPAEDIIINGKFTAIEYTATFIDENGETVKEVSYTVETKNITEPAVPEKQGYTGKWEDYTLAIGGVTIRPVYTISSVDVTVKSDGDDGPIGYKEEKTFTAKADNMPDGAEIHWFVNGKYAGTGESYTVEDPTEDYTVQAKVIDKDGNTIAESEEQTVKVRNGFFDRLKAFFAELIEKILGKAIADLLSSIC